MALSVHSQIDANKTKTWIIMVFFVLFIATIAYIIGKATGYGFSFVGIALIISGLMSFGSYYYGDKVVLALTNAKPADREKDFDLFTVAENIALAAGLPKPKVYVIEDAAPNAFATGRDPKHALVCVTRGLMQKLDRRELEGVVAHEMSHIQNFDTRLMAITTVLVGIVAFISDWFMRSLWFGGRRRNDRGSAGSIFLLVGIVFAIVSPIVATIIQLAISRRREFLADASAVLLTRNPGSLAIALEKISQDQNILQSASNATAHLFIANPVKGRNVGSFIAGLFNTHPPIEERIKILRGM